MVDGADTHRLDLLTVLRLLAEEAPLESYEELLLRAGQECSAAERLRLEQAVRLAYVIHASQDRHRQREDALAELVDTASDMIRPYGPDELLYVITRRVKRIVNADLACIGLREDDGSLCTAAGCARRCSRDRRAGDGPASPSTSRGCSTSTSPR
ncbi:hypothetical protein [Streptomyces spongiicola]|uniref:hypothetical protein n=1 Tax=Streptomyces spongiicola TaxID=1690221 RepID=UPI0021D0EEAF|nr:hypothetical protein [Streptomyces spongiicola]